MSVKATIAEILNLPDHGMAVAGKPRSGRWPKVMASHLAKHPTCAACGSKRDLNVHHIKPYHLAPSLELDPENLITLCRTHHISIGHLDTWAGFNPVARAFAEIWLLMTNAQRMLMRKARKERK
jgi:5-methylcytosine-specific restriction protein A